MATVDESTPAALLSRDELVATIAQAHKASAYRDSAVGGQTLAAHSRLPKVIAENLGAGFGQWDFFPAAADIVDFACGYVPPSTEDDVWTLARAWATDDAAGRQTVLALVGREILKHELRRVDVPKLRQLVDEPRPAAALALRGSLGLDVPATTPAKAPRSRAPRAPKPAPVAKSDGAAAAPAGLAPPPARPNEAPIPLRMPKPVFVRPKPAAPPPPAKRFHHPKFGEGRLESQNGVGPEAKLTIKFESGTKTLLARYVTELTT